MKRKIVSGLLSLVFLAVVSGSAMAADLVHKYLMRGQILEAAGDSVYLCIGRKDGAEIGQEYTVYKFARVAGPSSKGGPPSYTKEETGKVKITEIVDEHMAKAKITAGKAKANYVVELR